MGLWPLFCFGGIKIEKLLQPLNNVTFSGAHCLDLLGASADHSDPEWLVEVRNKEINIMKGWITQYYADLFAHKGTTKF